MNFIDDIWRNIFAIVIREKYGSVYKVLISLNKRIYKIGFYDSASTELANHLWTLIEMYPNALWNWAQITINPNTTLYQVEKHPNSPFKQNILSLNPNSIWEYFQTYILNEYHYINLSQYVTWDIVEKNLSASWDWNILSQNPNITWEIIQNNIQMEWSPFFVSSNINITSEIVTNNPDFPWDYSRLSMNPNMTLEFVKSNKSKMHLTSLIVYQTLDIYDHYRDLDEDFYEHILMNDNITIDYIKKHKLIALYQEGRTLFDWEWNWEHLSKKSNIKWADIQENNHWMWDWRGVSENPNITWKIVAENPNKKWKWSVLSQNTFSK